MKENKFTIYYWEFFLNDNNEVEVYNQRDGYVLGRIPDFDLEYVKNAVKDMSEQHVYDFIFSVIEYY